MQGWHSQRLLGSGEVTEPIVKEKGLNSTPKQKNLKNIGVQKQKTTTGMDLVFSHESEKQLRKIIISCIFVLLMQDCFTMCNSIQSYPSKNPALSMFGRSQALFSGW
jgi:hypothetical protein